MKPRVCLAILLIVMSFSAFSYSALDLKFTSVLKLTPAAHNLGDVVTFQVTFQSSGAAVTNMKIVGGVDGVQLFERAYASISANGSRIDTFTWTATAGDHTAYFTLDPAKTTGDSDYTNNNIQKAFNVVGGTSLTWEPGAFTMNPASPKGGDTVTFSHTFRVSQGPVENLKFLMSMDGIKRMGQNWAHIDAGETRTVSYPMGVAAISHTVVFQLDPDQTTNDVNHNDNKFEYTFTPQNVGTQVGWQNDSFTITPASPAFGNTIIFKMDYKVVNAPVDNLKIVAKLDGVIIKQLDVAHKEPMCNNSFAASWVAMKTGNHVLEYSLDPSHTTGDTDYSDNVFSHTFNIPENPQGSAPNLTIKNIKVEPHMLNYVEGEKIKICFSVVNDGSIASPSAQVTVSKGGNVFINYQGTGILNPGQSFDPCFDYKIECKKKLEIIVDPKNKVAESNEGDNVFSGIPCGNNDNKFDPFDKFQKKTNLLIKPK
jgi:hypothetical protein